ncbi:MAG: discoidin domain-containing protein [Clostridia bacterium]|nr:discoidin domain-containing protein [Clostridia bacterium]
MKKFIKNHLAVILSFAIVLTTILPVLSGVFARAESAEVLAAVETLKQEWVKLGKITNSNLTVGRFWINGANQGYKGQSPTSYTGTIPENVSLGTNYYEVPLTNAAINISGRSQQLFLEANSTNKVKDIEDMFFWVKPTFAGTENIKFNVSVTFSAQNTYDTPVDIPATKDGQWIKVSLNELAGGNWKANFTAKANDPVPRIELTFTGNNGDKLLVGAAHEVTARTLPDGSENWSAEEWLQNAKAVTGIANDDTAWRAAIIALEAALASQSPQELALSELKSAWKNLGSGVNSTLVVNRLFLNAVNQGGVAKNSANYPEALPAGVNLGATYTELAITDAAINVSGRSQQLFLEGNSTNTVGAMEDIVFWVKPTFAGTGNISFNVTVTFTAQNTYSNPVIIPASQNGQWIEVSLDNLAGGNWKANFGNDSAKPMRLEITYTGNNGDKLIVGSAIEVLSETTALPAESSSWDYATWATEARALDLTGKVNTMAFIAAIANLESTLGEEVDKAIAIKELKDAWKKLGSEVNGLGVGRYFGSAGTNTGYINKTPNTYTEELPAGVNLGKFWGEATLAGAGDMSTNKQLVLFELDGSTNTIGDIEDVRFWVKPTFAGTSDMTIKASVNTPNRNILAGEFAIPASKSGQWVQVSFDTIAGGDWKSSLSSALAIKPSRYDVVFSGNNGDTIVVGSALEVIAERALPAGSDAWTAEDWIMAAAELDLSGALNVDAFNAAVENLAQYVNGSVEELKAIGKFKTAWENLGTAQISTLVPNRYWMEDNSTVVQKSAASYKEDLPDGVTLGNLYGEISLEGAGSIISPRHQQLFLEGNSTNTVGDMNDIVFWLKPTFAGSSNITFNVTVTFSAQNTYGVPVTITPDKNNEWIEISLNEVAGGNWKANFNNATAKPQRIELTFTGNNGDKVIVGSAIEVTGKKALPAGTDGWNADKWIEAAEALDLKGSVNIAEFKAAIDELYTFASLSKEEKVAIKNLKSAWAKMGIIHTSPMVVNRGYIDGELTAIGLSSLTIGEELPEGVAIGNRFTHYDINGEGNFDTNTQVMFIEGNTSHVTGDMDDIFFWVRPKFAGTEDMTIKIAVTYSQRNTYANPVVIPASKNGEWIRISLDDVQGGDWKAALGTAANRTVMRLELCISGNAGDVLTVGSAFEVTSAASEIPTATENWNVADWLYATSHMDIRNYVNSDDFVEARAYAEQVRDKLLVARSCTLKEYGLYAEAEGDLAAIEDANILLNITPAISVFDGNSASEATSDSIANMTDGDVNTLATVDGLNGSSDTFVDFAFNVDGTATVKQMAFVNHMTNLGSKYYIYAGDSRSELFLAKNLVAVHAPNGDNQVQVFDFTTNGVAMGKFIGLRVYSEAPAITVPEFMAFGSVKIYALETGNFDNVKLAEIGKNLLKGIEPRFRTSTSQKHTWTMFKNQFSATSKIESLTDGDVTTGVGYYQQPVESADDKTTLHIFYDLGDTYTIEKLHLQHINLANYQTGEYEIYASPDLASLFSSKNKIITYDNRVTGPNGTTVSQLFTLSKQINARYISFCIKFPVSNFELLSSGPNQGIGIRIMELGVYGPRYVKPYALVNLGARTALDVTRIDAMGKSTKLNDGEYDGTEHKLTYDGKTDTYASVGMAEGEKLEFFYDLAADQVINKLQIKTNAGTIKQMKVYASDTLENMYKSTAMVFNYNAEVEDMGNEVFVDFTESPKNMRYVRFVIEDIDGNVFEPSEIEIIGGNDQEFFYNNLAEGKSDTAAFFSASDKGTMAISEHANKWKFGHTTWSVMYHSGNALDNDPDTVFDFYGGKNGEESINMLIDMGTLNSIDNVMIQGGSSEQYWPDEINFYFGTNDLDLYSEKAVPAKKWTSKAQDGVFSFDFVPQIAQYVRVEIVRSDDTIYSLEKYGNKIATVLSEIQVSGLEARGRVVNGVVASFTDKETGIAVDINALRDNDVYTTVQDILVKKRAATADEKTAVANDNNMQLVSDVYEIYLLDLNGNIVTDFDGRTITYRIPQTLAEQTEDVFLLNGGWGGFNMVEFDIINGYYCAVFDDATFSTFALGAYAEIEEELDEEEPVTEEEEEEDIIEEETDEEEEEEEEDKPKRKKKIKVVRKNKGENNYLWLIVGIGAGVVALVAAGVIIFIILKKKKKSEDEE